MKPGAPGKPRSRKGTATDAQLVRGPAELLEAMRRRAELDGQNVSMAWRRAAELYLADVGGREAPAHELAAATALLDAIEHQAAALERSGYDSEAACVRGVLQVADDLKTGNIDSVRVGGEVFIVKPKVKAKK